MNGSGIALNYGPFTTAGTYLIASTNVSTTCTSDMSGSAMVTVSAPVAPSVTLSTGSDVNICAGAVLTLTASPVNGGTSPAYQWTVNGTVAGSSNTYTYVPSNGDMVTARLTSDAACASPLTASATSLVTVVPYQTPAATITAAPGNMVCSGTQVTYNATASNGGSAPVYTWLKNNSPVSTGLSYTYTPVTGDVIGFMLTSNLQCRTADVVFSNTELMEADQPLTPSVSLSANPGTSVGAGQAVTLYATASNAGATPAYQWFINSAAVPGANTPTLESGTTFSAARQTWYSVTQS
jgi:hypothetical protein